MQVFIPIEHAESAVDMPALVPFRFGVARLCALREGFVIGGDGCFDFVSMAAATTQDAPLSDGSRARRPDASPAHRPDRR